MGDGGGGRTWVFCREHPDYTEFLVTQQCSEQVLEQTVKHGYKKVCGKNWNGVVKIEWACSDIWGRGDN